MLDVEESMLDRASPRPRDRSANEYTRSRSRLGDVCDDLVAYPAVETAPRAGLRALRRGGLRGGWRCGSCLACGNVGLLRLVAHAARQRPLPRDSTHPVMQSAEPDEDWRWCFVHHLTA